MPLKVDLSTDSSAVHARHLIPGTRACSPDQLSSEAQFRGGYSISALNRPHELKLHVKAALRNGLTREEIGEALLQVAIYCGIPAGIDSTRIAREAFAELELEERSAADGAAG